MGGIKRLPKTREEREFDKLMRDRKPSVWEDKGSVGDQHFRSLKAAAQHRTEANNAQNHGALPPLLEQLASTGAHSESPFGQSVATRKNRSESTVARSDVRPVLTRFVCILMWGF